MPGETDNPQLANLAAALASLAPSAGRFDRDQLLYRAGQASVRRPRWPWPAATATLAALAVGLGIVAYHHREPLTIDRIVYVPLEQPASPSPIPRSERSALTAGSAHSDTDSPPSSPLSFYRLEQVASRWGVDGLPIPGDDAVGESGIEPERMIDRRMQEAYFSERTR
jgi:hypothetical protein